MALFSALVNAECCRGRMYSVECRLGNQRSRCVCDLCACVLAEGTLDMSDGEVQSERGIRPICSASARTRTGTGTETGTGGCMYGRWLRCHQGPL